MAAAAGISNSIKQLAGSIGIALLTVIFSARTSYHAAHETVSAAQTYVEGVTDALRVVAVITLAALLPLLGVFRKKRPGKSGVKGAATPSAGRGRLRQNRQDNHLPDKTRIGRRPPDTNKTPAPGEGCRRIRMPGRVIPAPCVCGRRA